MASRIKGITVEIGGDATGLDKALKGVQSTLRSTQASLRDVNRLLKLDPKNTELLAQKQRLLAKQIESTKEKLETLKTADAQAKAQLEAGKLGQDKYDALQREIAETENALKRLQKEVDATASRFDRLDGVGQKMGEVGDKISGVGRKILPASIAVGGLGAAAVKTAGDFDAAMSQVAAVSGATGKDFQALRDKAREMGATTKYSASDAAQALGYMAQAGWDTNQMLSGIDGVMKLAASSGEDLAAVSDIVVGSLAAFGLKAKDAAHFADVLAAAAAASNTDVSQMGEAFEYAAPVAGALGFSIEDASEAIGLLSNSGIKASQAGTAMRTIFNALSKDVTITGGALGDVVVKTTNADGTMRSLNDILDECRKAFSGLSESEKVHAAESLVGKNAMSGFLALMNAAPEDIEAMRGALDNASGSADKMAKIMQNNLPGQVEELKSALEELAISIGDALMPTIRQIVGFLQGVVDKLNSMDDATRAAVIKIALFVAALGPAILVIGKVISAVGAMIQTYASLATTITGFMGKVGGMSGLMSKIGAAIAGISGPVAAVVAVIGVLVAAFVYLWKTSESFRTSILGSISRITAAFSAFGQGIVKRLNALGFNFQSFWDVIKTIWDGFAQLLAPTFTVAFSTIASVIEGALNVIMGVLDVFIGLFTLSWAQAWSGVKEIFSGIWQAIVALFTFQWNVIKETTDVVLGWFGTSWNQAWQTVKAVFTTIWNSIVSFFTQTWATITSLITGALSRISAFMTGVWNGIKNTAAAIWNGVKATISGIVQAIYARATGVFNALKNTMASVFGAIRGVASSVWNGIKNAITAPIEAAKNKIRSIINAIKGFFSGLKLSLPRIKLPHFSIKGSFSLVPPRVPRLSISWYKQGGIMTRPTAFGFNGSHLLAGGEAGPEAILPLKGFYDKLEGMLSARDTSLMEHYLEIIAGNSEKNIVLDSGQLIGALTPGMDAHLGRRMWLQQRGGLA